MKEKISSDSLRALGMMSGTSLDGIDIAYIVTDGKRISDFGSALTIPYSEQLREHLLSVLGRSENLQQVEKLVTEAHVSAVRRFLNINDLTIADIDVIGLHGQTITHTPHLRQTLQIGDGQRLASALNIDVVADFRSNDMANGGQGAPLAPIFHQALAKELPHPISILNIGGVANLTWLYRDSMIAFDTGPGNALIDDWILKNIGSRMDRNGELARSGAVCQKALQKLVTDPFFSLSPPKSLDRNHFQESSSRALAGLNVQDGAATLTAFTSTAISMASKELPHMPRKWLVSGGGRKNTTLMRLLQKTLSASVQPVESVGWLGDALEAQLMGFLAVRSLYDLPISFPTTTGVSSPTKGGVLFSTDITGK